MRPRYSDMHKLQELVRLHRLGRPVRTIARQLGISPNTERRFRRRLRAAGLLTGDPEALPDIETLQNAVQPDTPTPVPTHERSSIQRWRPHIEGRLARGAGPTAIHQVLTEEFHDFDGSLSAVKRLCQAIQRDAGPRPADVDIPVVTPPGEVAQVDFGYVGRLRDPKTGRERRAWVFLLVLGHSRHLFARVVFDQSTDTWLDLHRQAFEALGGVPKLVVPDNLKAAVIRVAFGVDEVTGLNRSYREFARHYGFELDPTPPRSPEKKGKVEAGVRYIKGSFFKPRTFADVHDCNVRLDHWVTTVAGVRRHGTTGKPPLTVFEQVEKAALKPLPAVPYQTVLWHAAKLESSSHTLFEGRFYSAPWTHIGQMVWFRATEKSVVLYIGNQRVACHPRHGERVYETIEEHLPEGRRDSRHRTREYWQTRADALSEEVGAYIRAVFDEDPVLRPLRKVTAMVRLLEAVPAERASAACRRASYFGNYTVGGLKRILARGLDAQPLPGGLIAPQFAESPQFARSAEEFLMAWEACDEPH